MADQCFDYIVVGAGSSGCAVAGRLSEDRDVSVLLIEAGPPANSLWVGMPAGAGKLIRHPHYNWNLHTEPVPALGGRRIHWPRGRVLGGSSAINGMVYMRGHPRDYDHWEALGNPGWGWKSVLPYFKRSEANQRGADDQHGADGPWRVSDPVLRHPSSDAFLEAASACGIRRVTDLNAPPHEGAAYQQFNIWRGRRQTAFDAFIRPARHRANLTVLSDTAVLKVLFDGPEATGVAVHQAGQRRHILAAREVILCGGAIHSPQLLMLSGIGPADTLRRHGIDVLADRPGVGRHLQDHWNAGITLEAAPGASYNHELASLRRFWHGARYLFQRRGYLALGSSPLSAYVRSDQELRQPDLQLVSRAMTFSADDDGRLQVDTFPGIGAVVVLLAPKSHGHLELRSADPLQAPAIHPNYLAHPDDGARLVQGLKLLRKILATEPMASLIVRERSPGAGAVDDDQLLDHIAAKGGTSWHPVGTCRMGTDVDAVVDHELKVKGVERLRVVDASIMPRITSGNTGAPAVMIGEKGADLIRLAAVPRRQDRADSQF